MGGFLFSQPMAEDNPFTGRPGEHPDDCPGELVIKIRRTLNVAFWLAVFLVIMLVRMDARPVLVQFHNSYPGTEYLRISSPTVTTANTYTILLDQDKSHQAWFDVQDNTIAVYESNAWRAIDIGDSNLVIWHLDADWVGRITHGTMPGGSSGGASMPDWFFGLCVAMCILWILITAFKS